MVQKRVAEIEATDQPDQEEALTNQTQFGAEEPLLEADMPLTRKTAATTDQPTPPAKSKRWLIIGVVIVVVLFIVLLLAALAGRQPTQNLAATPTPSPSPMADPKALEQRLNELEKDLRSADPIKLDLPFPPISSDVYIDKPTR